MGRARARGTASFIEWLRKVSGERPGQRAPLEQGTRFIRKWREGDAACHNRLGAFNGPENLRYIIVSTEDMPVFAHWKKFRDTCWRPLLGAGEQGLDERTLFLSIRDLEALAETLIALRARNAPRTISELTDEWSTYWTRSEHIVEDPVIGQGRPPLKGSLRDFLVTRYQPTHEHTPALDAFREAMDALVVMMDDGQETA